MNMVMDLERRYYEEYNKPLERRSDAVLDNLEFQLRVAGLGFAASVGKSNAQVQPGETVSGVPV